MAQDQLATMQIEHPAPARGQAHLGVLLFGLMGAPVTWAAHLLANVTIAGRACYSGAELRPPDLAAAHATQTLILAIDAVAALLALAALIVSYRAWRQTRHEQPPQSQDGSAHEHVAEVGEGRTRFIALGGILMSSVFFVAILFDTYAAIVMPECAN